MGCKYLSIQDFIHLHANFCIISACCKYLSTKGFIHPSKHSKRRHHCCKHLSIQDFIHPFSKMSVFIGSCKYLSTQDFIHLICHKYPITWVVSTFQHRISFTLPNINKVVIRYLTREIQQKIERFSPIIVISVHYFISK